MKGLSATERDLLKHLDALARALREGHDITPSWRISGADGEWLVIAKSRPGQPEDLDRLFGLVGRFLAWKKATTFLFGAETAIGPEMPQRGQHAIFALRVSREAPDGVMRRFRRKRSGVQFWPPEWLVAGQLDSTFMIVLPEHYDAVKAGESKELARIFGEDGEFSAVRLD